jgi:hypothetical protein
MMMMTAGKVMTVLARLIIDGDEMTIIIHNIMMVVLITNTYICLMIRSRTTEMQIIVQCCFLMMMLRIILMMMPRTMKMFVVPIMTMLMKARTTDVIMRPLMCPNRNDNDSKFPDVDEDNDDILKVG